MANVLWEFIQARSATLGIKSDQLADDFDIAPITMYRIKQCRPIREETKQKLARALKCCIGDINAAYAGTMPAIKDGGPSVMKTVDKLEQMIEEDYPELPTTKAKKTKPAAGAAPKTVKIESIAEHRADHAWPSGPDPEINPEAEKTKRKTPLRVIKSDPPPKEKWPEDPPEEKKTPPPDYVDAAIYSATQPPDVFGIKRARREAVAEYKQKLKDICIAAYLDVPKLNITGETATGYIGRALMKELLKDDTEAE